MNQCVLNTVLYNKSQNVLIYIKFYISVFLGITSGTYSLCTQIISWLLSNNTMFSLLKLWLKPKTSIQKHWNQSFILPKKDWKDQIVANHFLAFIWNLLWSSVTSVGCSFCYQNDLLALMEKDFFKDEMFFVACFTSQHANFTST